MSASHPTAARLPAAARAGQARSRTGRLARRIGRSWPTLLAALVLLALVAVAVAAPLVAPYDPREMHVTDRFSGPSARYLLGTDETGRDLLSLLIHAARISLTVAVSAQALALLLGVPLGLTAGYAGGWTDDIITRALDGLLAFPGILLALTIVGMFGTDTRNLVLALGIISAPYVARITRAAVLTERGKDYVLAAHALGASPLHLMVRTILPNCLSPIIVQASLGVAFAILTEASLSFLGLGVQPPAASWGTLLQVGYSYIRVTPWYVLFPGLCIFATVWSLNMLGDALRDALDPRLRQV
jgi:ABC-type dipeptide/oligopeptide/nickel transport system permease subunit